MKNIIPILIIGLKPRLLITNAMVFKLGINIHKMGPDLLGRVAEHRIEGTHHVVDSQRDAVERGRGEVFHVGTMIVAVIGGVKTCVAQDIDLALLVWEHVRFDGLLEERGQGLAEGVDGGIIVVPRRFARLVVIAAVPPILKQSQHALLDRVAEHVPCIAAHVDGDQVRAAEVVADVRQPDVCPGLQDLGFHARGVGTGAGGKGETVDARDLAEEFLELVGVGFLRASAELRFVAFDRFVVAESGGVGVAQGGVVWEDQAPGVVVDGVVAVASLEW